MKPKLLTFLFLVLISSILISCGKKEDEALNLSSDEYSSDKEKELKEKEEFLRLKEEQLKNMQIPEDSVKTLLAVDTTSAVDTSSVKPVVKKKEKLVQKEVELNKRIDNPKTTIDDYLEYLKRGINEDGDFDKNMNKASELWVGRSKDNFKANYKNTKKFVVVSEPQIVSQSDGTANVKVKVKQTDSKDKVVEMDVTYSLVADEKGKWKIKSNSLKKNNK